MKIVEIEDYFHPDAGYQINIISKYFVKFGHQVTIITGEMEKIPERITTFFGRDNISERDKEYTKKYGVKIVRVPLKAFISGRAVFSNAIYGIIKNEKPDVVYVHGNDTLTGMRYLLKYKQLGYPLIMDSHMLEIASRNKLRKLFRTIYRLFFTPIIVKNNIIVIRTQNEPYIIKRLGIPKRLTPWISVGSDTLLFHPDETMRQLFRKTHNIREDAFVIIYAGKLDEAKAGLLLAEGVQSKFKSKRDIVVLVVGKSTGEYGRKVEEKLKNSQNKVIRFPTQKYEDLAEFYQSADIAVFPRHCSLSFYDVQACGLPVVFENNKINSDRASHNNALVFNEGSVQDFRDKIEHLANMDKNDFDQIRNNAISFVKQSYDYESISLDYLRMIEQTYTSCEKLFE
ncbi:MAG: glycosyltransferase [Thermoguttaceae bacterium]|nr:glycosyltransferase [Thermoguttaceae bacterium]